MGRLIDADALIEEIKSLQVFVTGLRAGKGILNEYAKQYRESLLRIVDEQPTAYNVDAVVKQLKEEKGKFEGIYTDYAEGLVDAYEHAISVVKAGVVE